MIEFEELQYILKIVAHNLPFPARVVTQDMLEQEETDRKEKEQLNINPFSFEYVANNNMLGCHQFLSKYDYLWHNKYR